MYFVPLGIIHFHFFKESIGSFEKVDKINTELYWTSYLSSDGIPILGMNIIDFT